MEILIIVLLILINGFFSMSEIAIVSARKSKLQSEAERGDKSALAALKLIENPSNFLSTVQIGITLIGILTGIYSGATLSASFAVVLQNLGIPIAYSITIAQVIIIFIVTYFSIVIGELIPKTIGMNAANKISKLVARPMLILSQIAIPLVYLLSRSTSFMIRLLGLKKNNNQVTEEEIKALINEGTTAGEVSQMEQDIVERVFSLGDRQIGSLITPSRDVRWIDVNDSKNEIYELIKSDPHTIYPIADKNIDQIKGVVFLKDYIFNCNDDGFDINSIIKQTLFLSENTEVYEAIEKMRTAHLYFAIIIDEFGIVQGIVTLRDIMEGLVGELPVQKEDYSIIVRDDTTWFVDGQCEFYDFLDYFDLTNLYTTNKYNTISGLLLDKFKRIPNLGEKLVWETFLIEVVDLDGARIDKLIVSKLG